MQRRVVSSAEIENAALVLENKGRGDLALLTRFIAATGARLTEALALERSDIKVGKRCPLVEFRGRAKYDYRVVPLPETQYDLLRRCRGRLFPFAARTALREIKRALVAAGVPSASANTSGIRRSLWTPL